MGLLGLYGGYVRILTNKMETTTVEGTCGARVVDIFKIVCVAGQRSQIDPWRFTWALSRLQGTVIS